MTSFGDSMLGDSMSGDSFPGGERRRCMSPRDFTCHVPVGCRPPPAARPPVRPSARPHQFAFASRPTQTRRRAAYRAVSTSAMRRQIRRADARNTFDHSITA
ncbi:conserved hypothetical protein [Burkholderia pseudomallei Pakistan 9]|nr:conserved hypothetical protein [Burkholderia pseudomallei Pakistan 9]